MATISTGITLGILGGGQLGRMSALAAARLGISVVIFCPEHNSPASQVASRTLIAAYQDHAALKEFSQSVDFITYEFENIPVETIDYLKSLNKCKVYPDRNLLDVSQDRIKEKQFLNDLGIETAQWFEVKTFDNILSNIDKIPADAFIIKTSRFGYDGKGQIKCSKVNLQENSELKNFFNHHKETSFILESIIPFTHEISVVIARDIHGKSAIYGAMRNTHKNHILHETVIPAPLPAPILEKAHLIATKIAERVNLIGVLTVELFVCADGNVLANEIAPRTHNSGHWSIDACAVSQFENHVRTVCRLAVASPMRHSDARMLNLIGDDILNAGNYLSQDNTCLHLYGKHEIRAGRKMGHVTFLSKPQQSIE